VQRQLKAGVQVVDTRSPTRFSGEEPEPRPGVRSGHIPGSLNLPYRDIAINGRLPPRAELERKVAEAGIDLRRPITATCGSGVTAPMLALALESLGRPSVPVYDGSWTEWGTRQDLPLETGQARKSA
jgi:thiosulfate/3-mercaptopyruvate sulfurtransferase